jgi:translocation and assembly module TamB
LARISSLRTIAQPLKPPTVTVLDADGDFEFTPDSVWWTGAKSKLSGSSLLGDGRYAIETGDLRLRLKGDSVITDDFRWVDPTIPAGGGGRLDLDLDWVGKLERYVTRNADIRVQGAHLQGSFGITYTDTIALHDVDARFTGLDTRLIRQVFPTIRVPRDGVLSGRAIVSGGQHALYVDGDVAFDDPQYGRSRVIAKGNVRLADGFAASDLDVQLLPLEMGLVRALEPRIPYRGPLRGRLTLDGGARAVRVKGDLTLEERTWGHNRLLISGGADFTRGFVARGLSIQPNPVRVEMIRAFSPQLALTGPITGVATLNGSLGSMTVESDLTLDEGQSGRSRVTASGGISIGKELRAKDLRLGFKPLQLELARVLDLKTPATGPLTGTATISGTLSAMQIEGDLTLDERATGRSHVVAKGEVGFSSGVRMQDLRVRMDPVQVELVKVVAPQFPLGGSLSGTATLNGSTTSQVGISDMDVTHLQNGNESRLTGRALVQMTGSQTVDIDIRANPLSLETVGLLAPAAALRGFVTGPLRITGRMGDMHVSGDLAFAQGGKLGVSGTFDIASAVKRYDLTLTAAAFDANSISGRAPKTLLNGTLAVRGTGTDPSTMQATLTADLGPSGVDTVGVDALKARVSVSNGIAQIDTLGARLGRSTVEASGNIGLVANREGQLRYRVFIDSLSRFASFLPAGDSGVVRPRPGILQRRVTQARTDSVRIAEQTQVERAATGRGLPKLVVDTPRVVRREQLSGSLRAEGVVTGNVHTFGMHGSASATNVVALGNVIGRGTATYAWTSALTPSSNLDVDAHLENVQAGGFEMDTVAARLTYTRPTGSAVVKIRQNAGQKYAANADFTLDRVRNELRLNDMSLQFDTTAWVSQRATTVHWGSEGIDIDQLELVNQHGGRIYAHGVVPVKGEANLELSVKDFQLADIATLLQSSLSSRGLISFEARMAGARKSPLFKGSFSGREVTYSNANLPEVRGTFDYASESLRLDFNASRKGGQPLLQASGTVPVNLAISGVTGSRIPTGKAIDLTVAADSLPLEVIPQMTNLVTDVQGRATGKVTVHGTIDRPEIAGNIALLGGGATVVPLGIRVTDLTASIRGQGDTLVIDSVVANSSGQIKLTGKIAVTSLSKPYFDLHLTVDDARVIDNDQARLRAIAHNISIEGPYDNVYVQGDVRLRDGVIYIPRATNKRSVSVGDPALFNVLDTAVAGNREIFPAQSPLLAHLRMDVSLTIDRDVFARSIEANVQIYTDGELRMQVDRQREILTLDGTIASERGEYTYLSKRFAITRGSATFIGSQELNPAIQVTGEYEVRLPGREAINIRILVGGTMRSPTLSLESDAQPPISQSDLLSYLAFGRSSSSLTQLEGTALAAASATGNLIGAGAALASRQLAGVALGVFTDELAGEASRDLGLDVFTITPADIQTDIGDFFKGTEIQAGRYYKRHTFYALQTRLDPTALTRPGFQIQHWYGGRQGYRLELGLEPRYISPAPSLRLEAPATTSVFGLFLIREWRF